MEPMTLLPALAALTEAHRPGDHRFYHLQRTVSYCAQVRHARPDQQRPRRLEYRYVLVRAEAKNFNREEHLDYDTRYDRAAEFVEVVKGLWDSWEDGRLHLRQSETAYSTTSEDARAESPGKALPGTRAAERRRHAAGPPDPCAGRRIGTGTGDRGAATADVVYAAQDNIPAARAYYADVKPRMAQYGRDWDDLKIMPACARRRPHPAEAQAKFDQLQALLDPLVGLARALQRASAISPAIRWTARCRSRRLGRRRCAAAPTAS